MSDHRHTELIAVLSVIAGNTDDEKLKTVISTFMGYVLRDYLDDDPSERVNNAIGEIEHLYQAVCSE